jgi:hypothetical protein
MFVFMPGYFVLIPPVVVMGGLIDCYPPGLMFEVVKGGALGLGPTPIGGPLIGPGPAIGAFICSCCYYSCCTIYLPP